MAPAQVERDGEAALRPAGSDAAGPHRAAALIPILRRSFPPNLEREFQTEYRRASLSFVRIGLGLGTFLYLAFYFWDFVVDVEQAVYTIIIRLGVSLFLLGVIAISFVRLHYFLPRMQLLVGTSLVIGGWGVAAILTLLENGLTLGIGGMVLVLMYNFGFVRLLFVPSLISGVLIVGGWNITALAVSLPLPFLISNNFFLVSALVTGACVTYLFETLFRRQFMTDKELAAEKARADALIDNILPRHVATRLKSGEKVIAEFHGDATVLFSDLVGFTTLTKRLSANHLVELLNDIFSILDRLTEKHGVEKIKTIGDGYMVVSDFVRRPQNSAEAIAEFALDMMEEIRAYAARHGYPLAVRIGISTGQVVSGVIGIKKLTYDLWGETVNLASRMEASSETGHIHVSEATYWRLRETYEFEARGAIEVPGIGEVETYFLIGRKDRHTRTTAPKPAEHAA